MSHASPASLLKEPEESPPKSTTAGTRSFPYLTPRASRRWANVATREARTSRRGTFSLRYACRGNRQRGSYPIGPIPFQEYSGATGQGVRQPVGTDLLPGKERTYAYPFKEAIQQADER